MTAPVPPAGTDTLARGSAAGLGWTVASRFTGFLRVAAVAAVLGPTYLGNTFQAVNVLPNLVFYLVAGALIPALLVPVLVSARRAGDPRRVVALARGATGIAVALFGAAAVVAAVAAPAILRALSTTIGDPAVAADQRRVGTTLFLLVLPQVPLYAVAAVAVAVQHAHGRFGLAAGAPVLENLGLVVAVVVAGIALDGGTGLDAAGTAELVILGGGSTVAVALHAAAQWAGAARLGVRLFPTAGWRDPELRSLGPMAVPSSLATAGNVVREAALLLATNAVAGGVVAFQVAYNVYNLVTALSGKPVSAAALPALAGHHDTGDHDGFRRDLDRAWGMVAMVAVPASALAVVLALPLGALLAVGEMSMGDGPRLIAAALGGLGAAMALDAAFALAQQAAFARRFAGAVGVATTARVVVTVVGLVAGAALTDSAVGVLVGTGVAVLAGDVAGIVLLWRAVGRGLARGGAAAATGRAVVVAVAAAAPAALVAAAVTAATDGLAGERAAALAGGVAGAAALLVGLRVTRSPELDDWLAGFRR